MSSLESDSHLEDCGLCLQEGATRQARYFCKNCNSYICESCNDSHKRFQDLRYHTITRHKSQQQEDSTGPDVVSRLSLLSTQPSESINVHHEPSVPEESRNVANMSSKPSTDISETETFPSTSVDGPVDSSRNGIPKEIPGLKEANTFVTKVNIRGKSEERHPYINGCCFMPGGELVLCDFWGYNVKLLDNSFNLKGAIRNQGGVPPTDVAALNNETAVVTVVDHLQLLTISPSLQKGRTISVGKTCQGIDVAANQIYVCCCTPFKKDGEIRVYDFEWNLKKRIGKKTFSYLLAQPEYVSVSRSGEIFVLDGETVKCLSQDGKIKFQFREFSLHCPEGLYADGSGDVIVCDKHKHNIVLITEKGEEYRTLVSLPDCDKPKCVTYRPKDGTLAIGCVESDHLLVYKAS